MLISLKNGAADIIFLNKKMRKPYLGNFKREGTKSLRVLTEGAKNSNAGLPMHLIVNRKMVKESVIAAEIVLAIGIMSYTKYKMLIKNNI